MKEYLSLLTKYLFFLLSVFIVHANVAYAQNKYDPFESLPEDRRAMNTLNSKYLKAKTLLSSRDTITLAVRTCRGTSRKEYSPLVGAVYRFRYSDALTGFILIYHIDNVLSRDPEEGITKAETLEELAAYHEEALVLTGEPVMRKISTDKLNAYYFYAAGDCEYDFVFSDPSYTKIYRGALFTGKNVAEEVRHEAIKKFFESVSFK